MENGLIFPYYRVFVKRCGGTQEERHAYEWKSTFKRVARRKRKIPFAERSEA